ncbi:type 3 dihydrofolate reductase [Pseudidiomarina sp. 1APP75-32.1]|uniref:Dihydrofolate reductase n=1 Tax=Pseudidiomarina terrestris TaxID=2820060 RepID=A0AAW7R084_9GAMM|nr:MULTISPECIES: type 3 dihydrofolate reductase [unclassified Pseudidiomarina]MDN7124382.1 type 3 dihydrofolate reductase [Pseudidiomarina sp. 1APP75-32.1]MDN7129327.1 type 3 dihydrofolate reductase [Pseudidiomarina sp. 1APR75-15]
MRIALIAAMAHDRVIGKNGDMPWHLPAELQHFKRITMGKPVVMGRKTYESIGRPLPGRTNIVLSRKYQQPYTDEQGVVWVSDTGQAVTAAGDTEELMVIGGGHVYQEFLPHAARLYLTQIDVKVEGDTWFPDFHALGEWELKEQVAHPADKNNPHSFSTQVFERVNNL